MIDLDEAAHRAAVKLCRMNVLHPCEDSPCPQHLAQAQVMADAIEEMLPHRSGEKVWGAYPDIWQKRTLYHLDQRTDGYGGLVDGTRNMVDHPNEANLVGSRTKGPWNDHYPAIDVDLPVIAYPSSTPGHSHLFIDRKMKWKVYDGLLKALVTAGIVEEKYYEASAKEQCSYIFLPGKGRPPRPRPRGSGSY